MMPQVEQNIIFNVLSIDNQFIVFLNYLASLTNKRNFQIALAICHNLCNFKTN
jgi:hypothetical protein